MSDLNCDETVAERTSSVDSSKTGGLYHHHHHHHHSHHLHSHNNHHHHLSSSSSNNNSSHHQTPSVIVQLPNFYNLKTNKKFAPAYDSNSDGGGEEHEQEHHDHDENGEDSLGKPPQDILSDSHSDKVLLSSAASVSQTSGSTLDSSKLLLCYSTTAYNAGKGGSGGGVGGVGVGAQFRFSGLPEEEMDRNLMHIMVDGGSGSEIFKDDCDDEVDDDEDGVVLKSASDKDEDGYSNRCSSRRIVKDEQLQHLIHGKMDGSGGGGGDGAAELSFNFARSNHDVETAADDDRVLKRRELEQHFEDEELDGDATGGTGTTTRERHVMVDGGQNSNYLETSSRYATLTPLLLPLPPISNLIRRDLPSGGGGGGGGVNSGSSKTKHGGDHSEFIDDHNNHHQQHLQHHHHHHNPHDQRVGLMGSGNNGSGVENDGENGEGPGTGGDEDDSKKGDTSPFFTFHSTGGGSSGVGGSNNNHNSLTGDEHGLMLSTSDQFHSRYIDITLPEDLDNGDMGSRVITSYINSSPSHSTTLNSGGGVSGGGGQLNFFYDATNNFQAQHEINENIIGGQDRNTPKLSPTGSSGQCPKGVLTNGLILLNQAQSSEDMILDGIDADFVTSAKVVFKSSNNNNNHNHHHNSHHNHLGRIREDATLSSNVHGSSRIVQLHGGVYEQKGNSEKKRSDYYASKYSSSHENPYHEDGHHNNNNNNNNNGSLGEEKQLKQPHTEYLDLQSVNDVVAQSSASHHQNSSSNNNNHKYQSSGSRKRECSDGTRSPAGVSMSSLENEEINTKELAQKISAELKRYSIPQAIFAQRVLCRSQGTLSDLLRNPKPWSKLKSGRETFRRMFKWLQEPEFQRMSSLRLAAAQVPPKNGTHSGEMPDVPCPPKKKHIPEEMIVVAVAEQQQQQQQQQPHQQQQQQQHQSLKQLGNSISGPVSSAAVAAASMNSVVAPKKPRLVFTDLQRRTLQAIFKETKRPSKEMQVTIARQLGLEPTTVGNFFMNARRRSLDKWKEEGGHFGGSGGGGGGSGGEKGNKGSPMKENGSSSLSSVTGMSDDEHDDLDEDVVGGADHSNEHEMMHNFTDEILESEPYNQQHCNYDLL